MADGYLDVEPWEPKVPTPEEIQGLWDAIEEERLRRKRKKEQERMEQDRAIQDYYAQKQREEDARYKQHLEAAAKLGNTSLGGLRSRAYRTYDNRERYEPKPYVAFGPQAAQRTVKLSDVAMARMPKRSL